ncbi:MAG: sulfatase [Planctomycetaceae bacterium]|nr:sulfatase [Planctomycetaceae bacterium]
MTIVSPRWLVRFAVGLIALAVWCDVASSSQAADAPPNVVLIFVDDLGYGDLASFGAADVRTPNIDRLAVDGTKFTNFYVAQPVCTASRAALMTGCYSNRVGLFGALNHESRIGIAAEELLLPEIFKQQGYATAAYGKWHLGLQAEFNPVRNGFDEFFGIPYSNDNGPLHGSQKGLPPLPLMEGEKIVGHDPDQSQFTKLFTERACAFIAKNKERPFFLYVPHVMPHVPIFASAEFKGRSSRGLYGDVVEEVDWSVGRIVAAVDEHKLAERTLIIFTSDNGPFLSYGNHAGSAKPLREGKLTTFEGGVRSPCFMRQRGTVPAGRVCDELVASIDLLPTFAALLGAELPAKKIDGVNIAPIIRGEAGAKSPHEAFYYYAGEELQAVRSGDWKLHFAHDYLTSASPPGRDGRPANYENMKPAAMSVSGLAGIASRHGYVVAHQPQALYNLTDDVGETRDVAKDHPDVVARLEKLAEAARADLGDTLTKRQGPGVRPAGKLP